MDTTRRAFGKTRIAVGGAHRRDIGYRVQRDRGAEARGVMAVVLSIGTRALVTPLPGMSAGTLTDDNGIATGQTLAGGVEVEIVAWRAGGRSGNRYRVRSADG